jgi:hypothetical protein
MRVDPAINAGEFEITDRMSRSIGDLVCDESTSSNKLLEIIENSVHLA